MNETLLSYLLEFSFLALLGFLYYQFQKKRIINNDKYEINESILTIFGKIESEVITIKNDNNVNELSIYLESLREYYENDELRELRNLLLNPPSFLADEIKNPMKQIAIQIEFHI